MRPVTVVLLFGAIALSAPAQTPAPTAGDRPALPTPPVPSTAPRTAAPAPPLTESLRPFEPRDVRLRWFNRRWQLTHRGEVLKDFGPREQDARQALRVIQELRLNQHAVIGSPQPVLEYWLSDGKPPRAAAHGGVRTVPVDGGSLRVEQVHDQWCLRDAARVLFTFRQPDEAQQALAVLRKYQIDQVGVVGQQAPMYVPLSRSYGDTPTLPPTHGTGTAARHMPSPHFSRQGKDAARQGEAAKGGKPVSLDGFPSPAIPPLADPAQQHDAGRGREFRWRTTPKFAEQPATAESERVAFDWRQVQLKQDQGEWKLVAGGTVLGNFGVRADEARLALAALRYYRFTEQVRLGAPQPYLTYYVVNRAAPRGVMLGMGSEELQADKLELRKVDSGYALCQGSRVVVRLREREDEGRKLLEAIKRNHCDRLCRIGEPGKEAMTLLLRSR